MRPFSKNVETLFVFVTFWCTPQIVQDERETPYGWRQQCTQ